MAILAECPFCHKKQATKNRLCSCGADLVKLKGSKKVKYWISYRLPGGKQRREQVGYSIEEAKDAEGKRRGQKRENRIFEMLPESKMTFKELTDWYMNLSGVRRLISYDRLQMALRNFNRIFGDRVVNTIKPVELEEYQVTRETEGLAPATIDMELSIAKTMVNKAFDNDLVGGHTVRAFRKVRRKLKRGGNVRERILSVDEYLRLCEASAPHLRSMLIVAINTGMRLGELRELQWSHIDKDEMFVRLRETKESKPKNIPINRHVEVVLKGLPRAVHHDFVFTYRGEPIRHKNGLKRALTTACKKAGIPYGRNREKGLTFHDIRRTVDTNMVAAGIDSPYRAKILGHSLKGMDVHYVHPSDEDLTRAMQIYTAWLDEQIKNVDQYVDRVSKRG